MLHYVLGFGNDLIDKLEKIIEPVDRHYMRQHYTRLRVTKSLTPFNAFIGNHLRIIMENIYDITSRHNLPQNLHLVPAIPQIARALFLLKEIQNLTVSKFLSGEEVGQLNERVDHLLQHMRDNLPYETVKQKGHLFFRHGLEFVRRWGNLTWFYEHGIESLHAAYHRQAGHFRMEETRKQRFMIKWNIAQVLLEAEKLCPADAAQYEFAVMEDPAYLERYEDEFENEV